jgi:hypothetical protein
MQSAHPRSVDRWPAGLRSRPDGRDGRCILTWASGKLGVAQNCGNRAPDVYRPSVIDATGDDPMPSAAHIEKTGRVLVLVRP